VQKIYPASMVVVVVRLASEITVEFDGKPVKEERAILSIS